MARLECCGRPIGGLRPWRTLRPPRRQGMTEAVGEGDLRVSDRGVSRSLFALCTSSMTEGDPRDDGGTVYNVLSDRPLIGPHAPSF